MALASSTTSAKSPLLAKCILQLQQPFGHRGAVLPGEGAQEVTVPVFPVQPFTRKSHVSGRKRQLMLTSSGRRTTGGASPPLERDGDAHAAPQWALLAEHSLSSTMSCLFFPTPSLDMQPILCGVNSGSTFAYAMEVQTAGTRRARWEEPARRCNLRTAHPRCRMCVTSCCLPSGWRHRTWCRSLTYRATMPCTLPLGSSLRCSQCPRWAPSSRSRPTTRTVACAKWHWLLLPVWPIWPIRRPTRPASPTWMPSMSSLYLACARRTTIPASGRRTSASFPSASLHAGVQSST